MKKITTISLLVLMVVGMVFSVGMVNAYRGDYFKQGSNYNEERHELMKLLLIH